MECTQIEFVGLVGRNSEIGLAEMVAGKTAAELEAAVGKLAAKLAVAGIADLKLVGTVVGVLAGTTGLAVRTIVGDIAIVGQKSRKIH